MTQKNNKITTMICLILALAATSAVYANDINCYVVKGSLSNGTVICGVACDDATFYPMDCNSDLIKNIL